MNLSGELANWISAVGTVLGLIFMVVTEIRKSSIRRKNDQQTTTSSTSINTGLNSDLKSLIYTRIFLGIIIGFALSRFSVQVFLNPEKYRIFQFQFNQIPFGTLRVLLSFGFAILTGSFFSIVYIRFTPGIRLFLIQWFERTFTSLVLMGIFFSNYNTGVDDYGTTVYYSTYFSIFIIVLLVLFVSFPTSPIDLIMMAVKKLMVQFSDRTKRKTEK